MALIAEELMEMIEDDREESSLCARYWASAGDQEKAARQTLRVLHGLKVLRALREIPPESHLNHEGCGNGQEMLSFLLSWVDAGSPVL